MPCLHRQKKLRIKEIAKGKETKETCRRQRNKRNLPKAKKHRNCRRQRNKRNLPKAKAKTKTKTKNPLISTL